MRGLIIFAPKSLGKILIVSVINFYIESNFLFFYRYSNPCKLLNSLQQCVDEQKYVR